MLRRAVAWGREVGAEGDGDVIPNSLGLTGAEGAAGLAIPSMVTVEGR